MNTPSEKNPTPLCTTHDSPGYNMIVPKNKLGGSIPVHCSSSVTTASYLGIFTAFHGIF